VKVLLVKMSSLGDVVHCLPAASDIAAAGHELHWVVEDAFAAIPAAHPGVAQVLPIAWRRWRRALWRSRGELAAFVGGLRRQRYDLVLDAQGLFKSAAVSCLARAGNRTGMDRASVREAGAALFYQRCIPVPRQAHAIDRLRLLTALALGVEPPGDAPCFGLRVDAGAVAPAPDDLLLHGTTWASKHWPEYFWVELAERLRAAGRTVGLLWGDDAERARAERIAAASGAVVLPRQELPALMALFAGVRRVVGVDSGLLHLAGALGIPTLGLYGSTDAGRTGVRGARARLLAADFACSPCLRRTCTYTGPAPQYRGAAVAPACYASLDPQRVWQMLQRDDDRAAGVQHI
jgi:heptosyltransferase-1